MNSTITLRPFAAAALAAVFLVSCGKQEAVGDVPSSEQLAKEADAATAAIRNAAAADQPNVGTAIDTSTMTSYTNTLRGFTVMIPKGWAVDEAESGDNGRVFKNSETGGKLAVGWTENREDAALEAQVAKLEAGGVAGKFVNENEFRASGMTGNDLKTDQRILRKPDGTMVSAAMTYPQARADKLDIVASQILDSLTLQ